MDPWLRFKYLDSYDLFGERPEGKGYVAVEDVLTGIVYTGHCSSGTGYLSGELVTMAAAGDLP